MNRSAEQVSPRAAGSETGRRLDGAGPERPAARVGDCGVSARAGWFQRGFVSGVALLLGLTGGLKLVGVLEEARVLAAADAVFPFLTLRQVLFLAAGLELGVAGVLLRHRQARWTPGLILWLVLVFGGYRLGRWLVGWEGPCGCLGHLLERRPEFERWADQVMLAVLAIMGLGSCLLIAGEVIGIKNRFNQFKESSLLRCLFVIGALCGKALECMTESAIHHTFRVEGQVSISYLEAAVPKLMMKHNFIIWVSNHCWLARAYPLYPELLMNQQYCEAAFDGKEFRSYIRLRVDDLKIPDQVSGSAERYSNQQISHSYIMPYMDALWLAFASGSYLMTAHSNFVEPAVTFSLFFGAGNYFENPFTCQARWNLHSEFPHVPLTYYQIDAGTNRTRRLRAVNQNKATYPRYTNAFYHVLKLTNSFGFTVPLEAELHTYTFEDGPPIKIKESHWYRILANRVEPAREPVQFYPLLTGKTRIADKRYYQEALTVMTYSTNWPPDSSITNADRYWRQAVLVQNQRISAEKSKLNIGIVQSLLILYLATSAVAITAWKFKSVFRKLRKTPSE